MPHKFLPTENWHNNTFITKIKFKAKQIKLLKQKANNIKK